MVFCSILQNINFFFVSCEHIKLQEIKWVTLLEERPVRKTRKGVLYRNQALEKAQSKEEGYAHVRLYREANER